MRVFAALATILLLCAPARAQDAATRETLLAAETFAAMISKDMIANTTREMTSLLWPAVERELAAKLDRAALAELRAEFEQSVTKFAEQTVKAAPALYARHFTARELHEMTVFYRSPTGRKALQVMPRLMAEYMASAVLPHLPALQREIQAFMETALKRRGTGK
jgi:hypothetical protein